MIKSFKDVMAVANQLPAKDRRRFIFEATKWLIGSTIAMSCKTTNQGSMSKSASATTADDQDFDFIIVGTGAGGGPLAANLARKGHKILVMEAGDWYAGHNYTVPALHPLATVDPEMSWHFFVEHFKNSTVQGLDSKRTANGIFYPRAATVGGCTAHNAMITICPENSDWDRMAQIVNDPTFNAKNMRQYFKRMENCQYRKIGELSNSDQHGFDGWLPTTVTDPALLFTDLKITAIVAAAVKHQDFTDIANSVWNKLDPNGESFLAEHRSGVFNPPLSIKGGKRRGTREYLRETQLQFPDRLHIETNALVTDIVFADDGKTAIGVNYRSGKAQYKADPRYGSTANNQKSAQARVKTGGEVILAGGSFNTPQLLMLSGVGPREQLQKHQIPTRLELEGVGKNLQDRYEIAYVTEFENDFQITRGCTFGQPKDPCLYDSKGWIEDKTSLYASNGAVLGIKKKSTPDIEDPDLFIFGLPCHFSGYWYKSNTENYTTNLRKFKNHFSWTILKGRAQNNTGTVTLKSSDPTETPEINFNSYNIAGSNQADEADLDAVITGIKHAREIMGGTVKRAYPFKEVVPASDIFEDSQRLKDFVRNESWGHHASCTCPMGPDPAQGAVVDNNFRVHGLKNLRIVDASVFPKIPGLFIVTPIYMISEKASDVIHEDYIRGET